MVQESTNPNILGLPEVTLLQSQVWFVLHMFSNSTAVSEQKFIVSDTLKIHTLEAFKEFKKLPK